MEAVDNIKWLHHVLGVICHDDMVLQPKPGHPSLKLSSGCCSTTYMLQRCHIQADCVLCDSEELETHMTVCTGIAPLGN
jgi:hypothetical protein